MNTPPKTVRVTVPVAPEVLEAFKRLGSASGMSTGKAMGEWLFDTVDAANFMGDLLTKARATPGIAAREIHSYALGLADETGSLLDSIRKAARDSGTMGATRPGPGGQAPLTPPSSNTGGKVPKNTQSKTGGRL